jgi:hypothetical protein
MMQKYSVWAALLLLAQFTTHTSVAQNLVTSAGVVVLEINNDMTHIHSGWRQPLVVQAGTTLTVDDLVFPQATSLLVLCPDGSLKDFVPGELFANDKLTCGVPREDYVINVGGVDVPTIQRGGRQDSSLPYLISPRRTLVRSQTVDFQWNALTQVLEYQLTVFGRGSEMQPTITLLPAEVTQGDIAATTLTLNLQPNVAYTVEMCVTFRNTERGCTTDPGWASGTDLAFYYLPDPQLGSQSLQSLEQSIIAVRGEDTPESLYARAVLLSQPIDAMASDEGLAFTSEAIAVLNRLIDDHPNSALANAPEVHTLRGKLYAEVDLPLSAARSFQRATTLATRCTETAAQAYLGLALTTPNTSITSDLLNEALDNYHCLLEPEAFTVQYTNLCASIGDSCADLRRLQSFEGQN